MMTLDAVEQLLQARSCQGLMLQGAARILDDDELAIQIIIEKHGQAVRQLGVLFLIFARLLIEEIDPAVSQVPFLGVELQVGGDVRHHGVDPAFLARLNE
ncbi:hypothetical protein D3C72_1330280 [compost metagenome]